MNGHPVTDRRVLPLDERRMIDAVCDRFEDAWRAGERPDILSFLADASGIVRTRLFRELLILDLEYHHEVGEHPDASGYYERFAEHRGLIDEVFAAQGSGTISATVIPVASSWEDDHARFGPGTEALEALRAAGYEVADLLGRGGMGVVYRANQVALNRPVAIKVIRGSGFATDMERRRFQNEAEAVALLDHPHIVPIYEVGRRREIDFFSMKLIVGKSLDSRLAEFTADPRASARLVAVVARAVHHAHQRGILHRDLKPANILLDERGDPHVTDFGLARRFEGDSHLTHSEAIVGTPSYMSPEQANGKGGLTTATDVYGLGTILYALLTGRAPHMGSTLVETLDLVREHPPELPSKVNRRVPRDLEVICLKCLEKDPWRRYASAEALADDLSRWLAGEPIAARPVGPATRAWMWCQRHPLPAALAALLGLTLVAGFAGVTWKWREADRERIKFAKINDWTDKLLTESSTESHPLGARFTVVEMLDRAAYRIGGEFQDQPEIQAAVRERIGRSYRSLGKFAEAEPHLREAFKLNAALYGPEHRATLRVSNALNALLDESGRGAKAEPLMRRTLEACRHGLGPNDPITLDAANNLGALLARAGKREEAETLLRQTLAVRRRVLPIDHPDTLRSIRDLCLLLQDRARFTEAEALADEYEHGIRCARGPNHPDNVSAFANRGLICRNQGKLSEAEPFYRRAEEEARRILGPEHPSTLAAANEHARVLRQMGRVADAERAFRTCLANRVQVEGAESRGANQSRIDLATLLRDTGRPNEAEPLLREALEISRRASGPRDPETVRAEREYALVRSDLAFPNDPFASH